MSFPTNLLQNSYKSLMLGKPQQNECAQGIIMPSEVESSTLAAAWKEPRCLSLRRCLRASCAPGSLFVQCWHFQHGVLSIAVILTGANSLLVKQPLKTKCSTESELAAPLCAFFEMSADVNLWSADFGAALVYFCGFPWWVFLRFSLKQCRGSMSISTSQQCHSGALCIWDCYCWRRNILKESLGESKQVWQIYITKLAHTVVNILSKV